MSRFPVKHAEVRSNSSGFTLVEMILAIVISAILAVGIVDYIGRSVEGIDTTSNRNQLASAGRNAIARLSMELHNALPNSIRASTPSSGDQCIEFIPVVASTTYINPPFRGSGGTAFNVVEFVPDLNGTGSGTHYAVIYPRRANQIYDGNNGSSSGWPSFPTRGPIEAIDSIASGGTDISTITLSNNHRFNRRSPRQRIFVVTDPISYCIKSDKLYRYTDYGFHDTQTSTEEGMSCAVASNDSCLPNYAAAPDKMLVTDSIDNATGPITAFTVTPQSLNRNALVSIELRLASQGDEVRLNHEVLTRNVP